MSERRNENHDHEDAAPENTVVSLTPGVVKNVTVGASGYNLHGGETNQSDVDNNLGKQSSTGPHQMSDNLYNTAQSWVHNVKTVTSDKEEVNNELYM